jgi:predicted lactoylglutathione lyase
MVPPAVRPFISGIAMSTNLFVNLPVRDLERSKAFFRALGFAVNTQFSDDTAACLKIDDHIFAMLLTYEKFSAFTPKPIADAARTSEVLTALSRESRSEVDRLVDAALAAGATPTRPPVDHGFMYERSFDDLDGHIWEVIWMDPAVVREGQGDRTAPAASAT